MSFFLQDNVFISQLLDFLDKNSGPEGTETSVLSSFSLPQTPAGVKTAGVEIVQSRTTQTRVDFGKKKTEPDTMDLQPAGDDEVEQWLHGEDAQQKQNSVEKEDVEKKNGQVEKKFRVDTMAYSSPLHDGYFGYIVTQG